MAVLTLWAPTKAFIKSLSLEPVDDHRINLFIHTEAQLKHCDAIIVTMDPASIIGWSHVRSQYDDLKRLAQLINRTLGTTFSCCLVEDILYYAMYFDTIIVEQNKPDWSKLLGLFVYFAVACAILILSANICHEVKLLSYIHVNPFMMD